MLAASPADHSLTSAGTVADSRQVLSGKVIQLEPERLSVEDENLFLCVDGLFLPPSDSVRPWVAPVV